MNRFWTTPFLIVIGMVMGRDACAMELPMPQAVSGIIGELGCANCHRDLDMRSTVRDLAPDLSAAGLRYNPAYLYQFLRNPTRVRQHLGRARMPDFGLSEKEAVALVAFLETQRNISGSWPELPASIQSILEVPRQPLSPAQMEEVKRDAVLCLSCHTLEGKGGHRAVEWTNVSFRLQPAWVKQYLVEPRRFGVAPTNMPALFYRVREAPQRFEEMVPKPAEKIQLLADYLFSLNSKRREELEQPFAAAKARCPDATAAGGEALFRSLNCASCHRHGSIGPLAEEAAPPLEQETARVNLTWLTNYLRHPTPIRPFGYNPGNGTRMPDFRLSDTEAAEVIQALVKAAKVQPLVSPPFQPRKLSAFSRSKARHLLADKLSCLGCHRLEGAGGQIGPDLTHARSRLQPEYVWNMITKPRQTNPHAMMPQLPMPLETVELVCNFLLGTEFPPPATAYLSAMENPLIPFEKPLKSGSPNGKASYLRYCAACHGNDGRGDGFNARFLPRGPTAHADAAQMSKRSDDTLFDGVAAGGAILNKSHFMPAWGQSLSPDEIRSLVAYMRTLCQCKEPAWAFDNKKAVH